MEISDKFNEKKYTKIYNEKGEVQEIKEDYYTDNFSLASFLGQDIIKDKSNVKSKYSLYDVLEELSKHKTNDGINDLSTQLIKNKKLKETPVFFDNSIDGGLACGRYIVVDKKLIKDRKSLKNRLGEISKERYLSYIFNHEAVHAITSNKINNLLRNKKNVDKLNSIYRYIKQSKPKKDDTYELSNLDEFIAGIYTSPEFQESIKDIKLPKEFKSQRYHGGRNPLEKGINYLISPFRESFNFELDESKNILEHIEQIISEISNTDLKIIRLKGYKFEE